MKKSLFAIAFAVATTPFIFAAQAPKPAANPPAQTPAPAAASTPSTTTTPKVKKSHKKIKKTPVKSTTSPAPAAVK